MDLASGRQRWPEQAATLEADSDSSSAHTTAGPRCFSPPGPFALFTGALATSSESPDQTSEPPRQPTPNHQPNGLNSAPNQRTREPHQRPHNSPTQTLSHKPAVTLRNSRRNGLNEQTGGSGGKTDMSPDRWEAARNMYGFGDLQIGIIRACRTFSHEP